MADQNFVNLQREVERLARNLDLLSAESGRAVKELERDNRDLKVRVANLEGQVAVLRR
jgi:hypothetical protein